MTQEIEIKVADGVQVIRFLRADKKNAFTGPMYNAMSEALDAAETERRHRRHGVHRLGRRVLGRQRHQRFPAPRRGRQLAATARASRRRRSISFAACPR